MLMVLAGLLAGLHYARKMVNEFTDPQPVALPAVALSSQETETLRSRVGAFSDLVKSGKPSAPLVLGGDEINALLAADPGWSRLKGKIHVTIEGDQVKSQMSLPVDELGLPLFRNRHRYLNGDATFKASLHNGLLLVYIQDIHVKGKPVPNVYVEKIREINWADGVNRDTNSAAGLEKLQSIEVKNGKIIITPAQHP
jgi:hypothetical protein